MAKEDIFDKEWVDERDKNNLEGLLEQFNLPPRVITFVRDNKRLVQAGIGLLIIAVVSWSFYNSYQKNRVEEADSALSVALNLEAGQRLDALADVEKNFAGTDAALWAEIKSAQELATSGKVVEANNVFHELLSNVSGSSSLKSLLTFAAAQSDEALGNYPAALSAYESLKEIDGYQEIGLNGLGRVYEIQGELSKAVEVYQEHLAFLEKMGLVGQRALIEEKITRIKAKR